MMKIMKGKGIGYDSGDDNDDDDDDEQEADRIFDEKKSKMYIKEETRKGYYFSNRTFLLWLDQKRPQCVQESARKALQKVFDARLHAGATAKHKNMHLNHITWGTDSLCIRLRIQKQT